MKIEKIISSTMLILTVAIILLAATSCNLVHNHTFSDWENVNESTCTASGIRTRRCMCGEVEYDTVPALSHTPVIDAAVSATCTAPGKTEGSHCKDCGAVIMKQTETDKLAHGFSEWETVSESTCTSFGLKKRACECGEVEYDTVPALSHTPVIDAAVSATCTAPGKTEGSHCKDCGAVIMKQTETDKLAHGFSEWETVSESTCTSFGLKKRACECGEVEYDTVPALSHTPVIDAAVSATCTAPGKTEGSHCSSCGTIIKVQNPVSPTGHCCDDIAVLQEALCNLDGTKRFACTNTDCSYFYDESYSISEIDGSQILADALKYIGTLRTFDRFGNGYEDSTAFVISADGVIVTSNYKIDNAFSAVFTLGENEYAVTEVLAYDAKIGMAVLKVDATDLPCATICAKDHANAGSVYMLGAPFGLPISITRGIISNGDLVLDTVNYVQHDANINEGYGGGPLVNKYGEVIGLNVGYVGDDHSVSLAVKISALDSLDYTEPMSFEEYGNLTYTPVEELQEWVSLNYNGTTNSFIAYVVEGNGFYYSLGYDTASGYSFAEGYWVKEDNYQLYVRIILDNSEGTYQYYATFTDGVRQNEANGFIDAATYTDATVLTYDTFYGKYWTESELMAMYSTAVYDTLGFFSYCLDTYFYCLTLDTFGFASLSYDRDGEALTKLNNFIIANGEYESLTGSYVLSGGAQKGDDMLNFNISHHIETGNTVVSVHYSLASGAMYSAYLTLDASEDGNRFDFMYYTYDGESYVVQNVAWGYLDASAFTATTKLTCYVFEGMNEYEDGLLMDYTSLLDYMMKLLDNSVMPLVSPELSIEDLGFYFYFG